MSFYLSGEPEESLRLKSFSSSSRGGKATIRIELETSDFDDLGYALGRLAKVQDGQKRKPKAAIRLALPKPEDDR